jgi:hypothetical protein
MVSAWASCPENGYLGSPHGGQTRIKKFAAGEIDQDEIVSNLKKDIPYMSIFPITAIVENAEQIKLLIDDEPLIVTLYLWRDNER